MKSVFFKEAAEFNKLPCEIKYNISVYSFKKALINYMKNI